MLVQAHYARAMFHRRPFCRSARQGVLRNFRDQKHNSPSLQHLNGMIPSHAPIRCAASHQNDLRLSRLRSESARPCLTVVAIFGLTDEVAERGAGEHGVGEQKINNKCMVFYDAYLPALSNMDRRHDVLK